MDFGKAELKEIRDILRKNSDSMLKSNILGSDFSFLSHGPFSLLFKIEPMVFYKFLSVHDNALLSVLFPLNDFISSGTWPSIAMIDFEKPAESGKEFFDYVGCVLRYLGERNVKVASGHTGNYGNLGYGVAGSMAFVGLKKPVFSFARIKKDDLYYSVGNLGAELSYFQAVQRGNSDYEAQDLSIEKYVKELLKIRNIVHYVHDISEGGLKRGLEEISELVHFGFDVESEKLERVTAKGVEEYGSRIFSASSSGSLVVSVDPKGKEEFEESMKGKSWPILEIEKRRNGVTLDKKKHRSADSVLEVLS